MSHRGIAIRPETTYGTHPGALIETDGERAERSARAYHMKEAASWVRPCDCKWHRETAMGQELLRRLEEMRR